MRQKSKAIISFILSLILCFSFFPSTVYAADYHNLDGIVYVSPGSTDSPTSFVRYELTSYPSTVVDKNYWSKVGYFDVSFSTSINANANDKVTFKLDVWVSVFGLIPDARLSASSTDSTASFAIPIPEMTSLV